VEIDYQALSQQIDRSAYLQELVKNGGNRAHLEPYLLKLAGLKVPHFQLAIGFERLTQFLIGADSIQEASLFPVYALLQQSAEKESIQPSARNVSIQPSARNVSIQPSARDVSVQPRIIIVIDSVVIVDDVIVV